MAMQCFAKIGKFISLENGFLRSSSRAGINGWFGRLNGKGIHSASLKIMGSNPNMTSQLADFLPS